MIMQVHDDLLLEVPKDAVRAASDAARREMEGVASMRVPLRVDLKCGPNWSEMGWETEKLA